jgi:hypothetical protein
MAKHPVTMDGNSLGPPKPIVFNKSLHNDQLKTNAALQMEAEKIEFKLI